MKEDKMEINDTNKEEREIKSPIKKRRKQNIITFGNLSPIISDYSTRRNRSRSKSKSPKNEKNLIFSQKPFSQNQNKKEKKLSSLQISLSESQLKNVTQKLTQLKNDFSILSEYEKTIFKDTTLDIMFIMDITGSMGMWLKEAKENITNIIDEIFENNPGSQIRISFVGYRDFTEINELQGHYVSLNFTNNVNDVRKFISTIDCFGGGDEPEDVVGAFNIALGMNWVSDARYAVLVCDAPCHGKKYHNITYDKYINGDPKGLILEDLIKDFKKKNITLYCIEINDSTKIMFRIMKDIYNDDSMFHIETLGNAVNKFSFFVAFSASLTLTYVTYSKVKFENVIDNFRNQTIEMIAKKYYSNFNNYNIDDNRENIISQIENLNLNENEQKMFDFINRLDSLNLNNNNNNSINIEKNNLSDNSYIHINLNSQIFPNYCGKIYNVNFYSIHLSTNLNLLINWNKVLYQKNYFQSAIQFLNNFEHDVSSSNYILEANDNLRNINYECFIPQEIKVKEFNDINLFIDNYLVKSVICSYISDSFNIRIFEDLPSLKQFIKFKQFSLIEIINNINEKFPSNYLLCSNKLSFPSNDISIPSKKILDAFSHFSFQYSEGNLLISNLVLDEKCNLITKYKIYKNCKEDYKDIMKFFISHYCNEICYKLKLFNPKRLKKNEEIKIDFFTRDKISDSKLCECCKIPMTSKEKCCQFCSKKILDSQINCKCEKCGNNFSFSLYYYNMKMICIPKKCENCTFHF